jgi:NAD+-dependent protein deacetylase sirtuin 5
MHGSIFRTRCTSCQHVKHSYDPYLSAALRDFKEGEEVPVDKLPRCGGDSWAGSNRYAKCGGLLRPDVVWFGEVPAELGEIARKVTWCDLLLVVGTSALVRFLVKLAFEGE